MSSSPKGVGHFRGNKIFISMYANTCLGAGIVFCSKNVPGGDHCTDVFCIWSGSDHCGASGLQTVPLP